MKDWRLAAGAEFIDHGGGVHICVTVDEQRDGCDVAVFGGYVQERSASKCEVSTAGLPAIEFGKTPVNERGIGVDEIIQAVEPVAQNFQHARQVVPGCA